MNQKIYWLRGGIIGLMVGFVLVILALYVIPHSSGMFSSLTYFVYSFPEYPWAFIFPIPPLGIFIVLPAIYLMLDGFIIGWIYGMLRRKNEGTTAYYKISSLQVAMIIATIMIISVIVLYLFEIRVF